MRPSAGLSWVEIDMRISWSVATQSIKAKCLMSMWRVRLVGLLALAMAMAASLSSYNGVALAWVIPRSSSIDRRYRASLPASTAAMNSASVDDCEMVGWNRALYTTGAPAKHRQRPEMERRWDVSPAQSESTKPTGCVVVLCGIWTSWLSCRMDGHGLLGSRGFNVSLQ